VLITPGPSLKESSDEKRPADPQLREAGQIGVNLAHQSLQDPFLETLRKDRIPVSIFLLNGIKLQGQIEAFDQYAISVRGVSVQVIYKHVIATIVPARGTPSTPRFVSSACAERTSDTLK